MKKHYVCPASTDFGTGAIAEIYDNSESRVGFQGRARLIEELDSCARPEERYYIRAQFGSGIIQSPHTIIWSWKRWRVEFIDGPNKGWITARKIAYYVTVSSKFKY